MLLNVQRNKICDLSGKWQFIIDPQEEGEEKNWYSLQNEKQAFRTIDVPFCWQTQFEDLQDYIGSAWYKKTFIIDVHLKNKQIWIVFGAVNYLCKVWINGHMVGNHKGGTSPFFFNITKFIQFGKENFVAVKTTDLQDISEIPHGKIAYYSRMSGIWQNVWLESRGQTYISDIFIKSDIDNSQVEVNSEVISSESLKNLKLKWIIKTPDGGKIIHNVPINFLKNTQNIKSVIKIKNPLLWNIETPNLYQITGYLIHNRNIIDDCLTFFGMRKISINTDKIYLNNELIYPIGVGNNQVTPQGIYTQPSEKFIKKELKRIKKMGFNLIRQHVFPPDPRYAYWADRLGILLWQEPAPFTKFTGESFQNFKEELAAMIVRDRNHPSIIMWGLFNECWGVGNLTRTKLISLIKNLYGDIKKLDSTRLILDNSGGVLFMDREINVYHSSSFTSLDPSYNYKDNHCKTDLEDIHGYVQMPWKWKWFKGWVANMKSYRGKPFLITEFGSMLFPDMTKIKKHGNGKIPAWWNLCKTIKRNYTADWTPKQLMLEYEDIFYKWHLDKIYGDMTNFVNIHNNYFFSGLKYQIEQFRKNGHLNGYLGLSVRDSFCEPFGVLDYYGEKKVFNNKLSQIQKPCLLFLDWEKLNFWSGDKFISDVYLSNYDKEFFKECVVKWNLENFTSISGMINNISINKKGVNLLGEIDFTIPDVKNSISTKIKIILEKHNRIIYKNELEIFIFPQEYKNLTIKNISIYDPTKVLYEKLLKQNCEIKEDLSSQTSFLVSTLFDKNINDYLIKGGSVLLLEDTRADYLDIKIGTLWPLYGIAHYANKQKSRIIFNRIPYKNPLDWQFYQIFPDCGITGIKPVEQDSILTGCYSTGWFKMQTVNPSGLTNEEIVATTAKFKIGKGNLLLTTFKLIDHIGDDPVATIMFDNLINYICGYSRNG
ncbi:MAG: hypothetical protein M1501_01545 [Candidatus Omnitrophica bacterium]|nr:hypothetical protein [Candidatus Omnitrophota bacterium]